MIVVITLLLVSIFSFISDSSKCEKKISQLNLEGDEIDKEAALKAVIDSQEKFCGVSNMLKRIVPVTWDVTYNGVTIFSNQKEESAVQLCPII